MNPVTYASWHHCHYLTDIPVTVVESVLAASMIRPCLQLDHPDVAKVLRIWRNSGRRESLRQCLLEPVLHFAYRVFSDKSKLCGIAEKDAVMNLVNGKHQDVTERGNLLLLWRSATITQSRKECTRIS